MNTYEEVLATGTHYTIGVSSDDMVNNIFRSGQYDDLHEAKLAFFNLCILLNGRGYNIELKEKHDTSADVIYSIKA